MKFTGKILISLLFLALSWTTASASAAGGEKIVMEIKGMTCPFCAQGVKKQIRKLSGVQSVKVSSKKGQAVVITKPGARVSDAALRKAVIKAGFKPREIKRIRRPS